jgi:mono/diheme cytochrome c family protein
MPTEILRCAQNDKGDPRFCIFDPRFFCRAAVRIDNIMKWLLAFLVCISTSAATSADQPVDYLRDVKPILAQHCYSCHGAQKQKSGLRLDTAAAAQLGGNSGPAVVSGKSNESRLIRAISGSDKSLPRMPFKKAPLDDQQIALLKTWIDEGAKAPANERPENGTTGQRTHWAFQPLVRPAVPPIKNQGWVRNPIDRFILARLEKEGIAPAPEADRITLIRRLSLDLLGLPPSVEEIDAFLADARPDAYERLVDRLLHSPHYGERWGRHWLDLARYADSNGFNIDAPRSMWKYRDWVIDAFNADLPFDQFTIEQMAGDLLPDGTLPQKIATGFHRNTLINEEGGIDLEQFRVESIVDRVNTTGSVFLGLTVGCAQCHDHKFDPISQREYYQLFAFFNNADEPTLELPTAEQERYRNKIRTRIAELNESLRGIDNTSEAKRLEWEKSLTPAARASLLPAVNNILDIPEHQRDPQQLQTIRAAYRFGDQARNLVGGLGQPLPFLAAGHLQTALFRFSVEKQIADLKTSEPAVITTLVMEERKTPRPTHIHLGGDFLRKGARVAPGVPAVLPPLIAHGLQPLGLPTRLDLARWLVDPGNPLTPRVTMNRFWERHFGLGLVETDNDFGMQGTRPTHPELLDWLATEFIAHKWSMKAMHRLIVTSATYRQSSRSRPELAAIDPRNQLLARQARLRLDAEIVRDVALAASGLLSRKIGGPSVFPPQPDGVFRLTQIQREWKASDGPDRYRRGMYTHFWRSAPHPALTVFDAPEATTTCTRRNRSNTPLQALTLLNDQGFFEFAQGLAVRILANPQASKQTDSERIRYAFRLCLARPPSDIEEKRLGELLAQQLADLQSNAGDAQLLVAANLPPGTDSRKLAAWTTVARVLLNLDEFITRE